MPIFDKYKAIFVHIPKCAGTSISNVLAHSDPLFSDTDYRHFSLRKMKGRNLEHLTGQRLKLLAPIRFHRYYKFAFVRNPYDRMVSEFKWRSSWDPATKNEGFETMLEKIPYYRQRKEPHFYSAYSFLTNQRGESIVDYVGKFETIDDDFVEIAQTLNLQTVLPKKNITNSEKVHYSSFYNKSSQSLVKQHFLEDFENFDYSKNF